MEPAKHSPAPTTTGAGRVGHGRIGGALYSTASTGARGGGRRSVHEGEGSQEAEGQHELGRAKGWIRVRVAAGGVLAVHGGIYIGREDNEDRKSKVIYGMGCCSSYSQETSTPHEPTDASNREVATTTTTTSTGRRGLGREEEGIKGDEKEIRDTRRRLWDKA